VLNGELCLDGEDSNLFTASFLIQAHSQSTDKSKIRPSTLEIYTDLNTMDDLDKLLEEVTQKTDGGLHGVSFIAVNKSGTFKDFYSQSSMKGDVVRSKMTTDKV
jgi:hypothetical protein